MPSLRFLRFFAAVSAVSCAGSLVACGNDDPVASDDRDLINGKAGDSFGATLVIEDGCTAAKVGPRHILLAAHCVEGAPQLMAAGKTIRLGSNVFASGSTLDAGSSDAAVADAALADAQAPAALSWRAVTIDAVALEPFRLQQCHGDFSCVTILDPRGPDSPDVAIVTTKEALDFVPATAKVDLDPVVPGDELFVVGAGCEDYVWQWDFDYTRRRVKSQKTRALSPYDAFHRGSHLNDIGARAQTAAAYAGSFFATPGPDWEQGAPGLCPGDSGGPVYRAGVRDVVVGVNATYTFKDFRAPRPLPTTNGHTRLDLVSKHDVGAWLESLGVATTRSCATRTCRPMPDGGTLPELDAGLAPLDAGTTSDGGALGTDGGARDGG